MFGHFDRSKKVPIRLALLLFSVTASLKPKFLTAEVLRGPSDANKIVQQPVQPLCVGKMTVGPSPEPCRCSPNCHKCQGDVCSVCKHSRSLLHGKCLTTSACEERAGGVVKGSGRYSRRCYTHTHIPPPPHPSKGVAHTAPTPGGEFFSTHPYVFTEGCLGTFSGSKVAPPYRHPHVAGDAHSKTFAFRMRKHNGWPNHSWTNLSAGAFDVPVEKSFMNAVVVVIDSLSRAQIMAYMPRVRRVLLELHMNPGSHGKTLYPFLNSLSLEGTTPYAFSALLSGVNYKTKTNHRTWLHDDLKEKGYAFRYLGRVWPVATAFQAQFPEAFSRMVPEGAMVPGGKVFVKEYATKFEDITKLAKCNNSHFCKIGSVEEMSLQVEHLLRFWRESLNSPKLAVLHFLGSHAPNAPETMAAYDRVLADLLQNLIWSRNMNVVFLTDHGRLDDEHSFQFPLMSAVICKQGLNEERKQNMAFNSQRMVTLYDMYHTLRHLLLGDPDAEFQNGVRQEFERSMLASKITMNRTCTGAGIPPSVCPCLARSWIPVSQKREATIRPMLEKLLRSKQQTSCATFDIQKLSIISPKKATSSDMMENFIRAEIHVQEGVIFEVRGYMMGKQLQLHSLKQRTSYRKFEVCTPKGGNAQYCICAPDGEAKVKGEKGSAVT